MAEYQRTRAFVGMRFGASTYITILVVQKAERRVFGDWLEDFSYADDFRCIVGSDFISIDFLFHVTLPHVFDDSFTARPAIGSLWR